MGAIAHDRSGESARDAGANPAPDDDIDVAVGSDDYALRRVPQSARYSWISVAFQRFGQLSALAQFMLAAFIGFGMKFWDAMLAITLGAVVLEIVTIFVGIAGMREGLSTSVLARWAGFGRKGSALVALAMAVSLTGWFTYQNGVFASGMQSIFPGVPFWVMALLGGIAVTLIVVFGFASMTWIAYVTVPAFLVLCVWAVISALQDHSLSELMSSEPSGAPISMATAITFVAGGFIVGAIMTPDMARYNRSVADVVKQTLVGVTLGEYFVGAIGVLLAHTIKEVSADSGGQVVALIQNGTGVLGVIILVVSILKINDWNLYPSSLGVVNAADTIFGIRINRVVVSVVLGVVGSVLSAIGITESFAPFLNELGIFFPPIAGIMIADYFVLRSWRSELDESRAGDLLPSRAPEWNIAGLLAWGAAYAFGKFSSMNPTFLEAINIPAITSLIVGFVVYLILGKLGLGRGVMIRETIQH